MTTNSPGYFIATPVLSLLKEVLGVVAIKVDLTEIELGWQTAGENIFVTNQEGIVLLASNNAWHYKMLR